MTMNPQPLLRQLASGRTLHLDDAVGQCVVVFRGLLWITQDRDRRDVFVGRGESFTIDRPGRVVIEAMEDSRLLVLDARAAGSNAPSGAAAGAARQPLAA